MNRLYINKDWSTLKELIAIKAAGGGAPMVEYTVTGNPATFETNVIAPMELLIPFVPVQDLHGQANPYPAGGGKNICDPANTQEGYITAGGNFNSDDKYRMIVIENLPAGTYTFSTNLTDAYIARTIVDGAVVAVMLKTQSYTFTSTTTADFKLAFRKNDSSAISTEPNYQVESGNQATTYAPYSNLCPISGWNEADITGTGKNLFDKTAVTENKYIKSDGEITSNNSWNISDYIPVNAGGSVSYKGLINVGTAPYSAFYDIGKNFISSFKQATGENTQSVPANAKYVRFSLQHSSSEMNGFAVATGTSVGEYEAYTGETHPITFPSTVYGGTLTVNKDGTGKLVVDREEKDLGSLSWTYASTNDYFRASLTQGKGTEANNIICSAFEYAGVCGTNSSMATAKNGTIWKRFDNGMSSNATHLYVKWTAYTDANQFITAVTGQKVVYELATPVEIDLTELEVIETLNGVNNVWTDTNGENTVKYMKKG